MSLKYNTMNNLSRSPKRLVRRDYEGHGREDTICVMLKLCDFCAKALVRIKSLTAVTSISRSRQAAQEQQESDTLHEGH